MANYINWVDHLSRAESETYAELVKNGIEVYPVPIVIENDGQLSAIGVTSADCVMQWIGPRKVRVHLSPGSKEVYDLMYGDTRNGYRREARRSRCLIPGAAGLPIQCPDSNKCRECPFPEIRDRRLANDLSWEQLIDDGYDLSSTERIDKQIEDRDETDRILALLKEANPELAEMAEMAAAGLSVKEIAERMDKPLVTVYKRLERITRIGNKYREENL